jgi:galactokinase
MSELDEAIARLEAAVARLDAASGEAKRAADDKRAEHRQAEEERVREVAAAIAGRVDAALARLGQLLEREE